MSKGIVDICFTDHRLRTFSSQIFIVQSSDADHILESEQTIALIQFSCADTIVLVNFPVYAE